MTDPIELDLKNEEATKEKEPEENKVENDEVDKGLEEEKGEAEVDANVADLQGETEVDANVVPTQGETDAPEGEQQEDETRCETRTIIREPEPEELDHTREPSVAVEDRSEGVSPAVPNVIIHHLCIVWIISTTQLCP